MSTESFRVIILWSTDDTSLNKTTLIVSRVCNRQMDGLYSECVEPEQVVHMFHCYIAYLFFITTKRNRIILIHKIASTLNMPIYNYNYPRNRQRLKILIELFT